MLLPESNNLLEIIETLNAELQKSQIRAEVHYRLKHPNSILEKMLRKNLDLHEINDLVAFRFIVQKLSDCYRIMEIIRHTHNNNVDEKDYIARPKENGYRSLHIMISNNEFMRNVEIQIRTKRMHNVAELGSASHSRYKDEVKVLFNTMWDEFNIGKACDIWHKFQWTIPELDIYEEEIRKIWYHYKSAALTSR